MFFWYGQGMDVLWPLFSGWLPILGKILLSALLGGMIGYEREAHGQSAGFRTNMLVSVGACLLMLLSMEMEAIYNELTASSVVRLDPGRIASYAIASMGFLGAGAILKGRGSVRGLTTAASLWLVTGVGLSIGAGFYPPAILTTLISVIILYSFRMVLRPTFRHDLHTVLSLTFSTPEDRAGEIREILQEYPGVEIQTVNYSFDVDQHIYRYRFRIVSKDDLPRGRILERFQQRLRGITEITWEEGRVP
jgi:putative Mg2+ transporter-C (MgtC) family protein